MNDLKELQILVESVDFESWLDEVVNDSTMDESVKDLLKKGKKFADWAAEKLKAAKEGLKKEKVETKDMLKTFFSLLKRKLGLKDKNAVPTEEEIKAAISQLKDVAKVALVAAVLLGPLPGDEPILIGIELLARKFGLTVFPSALQNIL